MEKLCPLHRPAGYWLARVNRNHRQERTEGWTCGFPTHPLRGRAEQRNSAIGMLLLYKWNPWIMERPGNEREPQKPKNILFRAEGIWWHLTRRCEEGASSRKKRSANSERLAQSQFGSPLVLSKYTGNCCQLFSDNSKCDFFPRGLPS